MCLRGQAVASVYALLSQVRHNSGRGAVLKSRRAQFHVTKVPSLVGMLSPGRNFAARLTHSFSGKYFPRQGLQRPAGQRVPWPRRPLS